MSEAAGHSPHGGKPRGIVVGVDGSDQSMCALVWAAQEAERRRTPLHLVTAYTVPIFAASGLDGGYATVDDTVIREGAETVLNQASAKVADYDIEIHASVETGDAAGALLEQSENAELIVVGSRGKGGFFGRLLGSVSSALPAHTKCPTVVIPLSCAPRLPEAGVTPPEEPDEPVGRTEAEQVVMVGVDGSEQARAAVLVAAEQAQRWNMPLRMVCAVPPFTGSLAWVPAPLDREALYSDIQVQLDAGKAWLQTHFPGLEISHQVFDGAPVEVLIDASAVGQLMVVGSRGRGGFTGMLLGSTSQGVLHHAKGPLMVVPDHQDERLANRADFGPILGS